MAGIADLLYLGSPDPSRQLAALLSGQPQPGAPPPGAAPGAAPPQPGAAADPNAPNPAPGQPAPPGSQPQPTALQSSPDMAQSYQALANPPNLMSLYIQMQQRDRAMQGINSGLALIAANHSPPSMRQSIMQALTGGGEDAGSTMNNIMSLYSAQQGMAARQQELASAPEIAAKTGMPIGYVQAEIAAGRGGELMRSLEPTTETRDIQAKHDMFIKNAVAQGQDPQAAEQTWQRDYMPFLLTGGAGGGDSATRSWQTERIRWNQDNPGQPYPWGTDDPQSFALWKTKQDELVKDQQEANNKRPGYTSNLTSLRNDLGTMVGLKSNGDPNNDDDYDPDKLALFKKAINEPGAQAYLSGDPTALFTQAKGGLIPPEEKAILDKIRSVTDPKSLYGTMGQRAPKRGQSDVSAINSGLNDMTNIRQGPDRYFDGVKETITAADKAVGNAYGGSGEAENAPDYTKGLIDDAYLPGGSMYPFGKKPAPMSPDQIAQGQAHIKANPGDKAKIIKILRANNFDPTPLM